MPKEASLESTFIDLIKGWEEERQWCEGRRRCVFSMMSTVWLMISQRIIERGTLKGALEFLKRGMGSRLVETRRRIKNLSSNTGGLSKARSRIPVEAVEGLSDYIYEKTRKELLGKSTWRGRSVCLIDGTTLALANTASIREEYEPHEDGQGARFPIVRVVTAHCLVSGIAARPVFGSRRESEQSLASRMYGRLNKGTIVVGDSNYGTFANVYRISDAGHKSLVRLQLQRANKILGRVAVADIDQQISWTPSKKELENNSDLPATGVVSGRFISVKFCAPGFRSELLCFFTTDLTLTAQEIVELYGMRGRIETDLRHIKIHLHLDEITAKTADMVAKEIILGFMSYNLIRTLVYRGATQIGVEPRRVSLTSAIEHFITLATLYFQNPTRTQRKELHEQYLRGMRQILLPNRKKTRIEPRQLVKKRFSKFPLMREARHKARNKVLGA